MIDYTIVAVVVFAVAILYVVERKTRSKSIDTGDFIKLGALSGGITSAILYSIGDSTLSTVTEAAEDMFVGKPSF